MVSKNWVLSNIQIDQHIVNPFLGFACLQPDNTNDKSLRNKQSLNFSPNSLHRFPGFPSQNHQTTHPQNTFSFKPSNAALLLPRWFAAWANHPCHRSPSVNVQLPKGADGRLCAAPYKSLPRSKRGIEASYRKAEKTCSTCYREGIGWGWSLEIFYKNGFIHHIQERIVLELVLRRMLCLPCRMGPNIRCGSMWQFLDHECLGW